MATSPLGANRTPPTGRLTVKPPLIRDFVEPGAPGPGPGGKSVAAPALTVDQLRDLFAKTAAEDADMAW